MKRLVIIVFLLLFALDISFATVTAYPAPLAAMQQINEFFSFGFTFVMGFLGGYLIWGLLAAVAAVGAIYLLTKDKKARKYAWIGCIAGCALGLTLKIISLS